MQNCLLIFDQDQMNISLLHRSSQSFSFQSRWWKFCDTPENPQVQETCDHIQQWWRRVGGGRGWVVQLLITSTIIIVLQLSLFSQLYMTLNSLFLSDQQYKPQIYKVGHLFKQVKATYSHFMSFNSGIFRHLWTNDHISCALSVK